MKLMWAKHQPWPWLELIMIQRSSNKLIRILGIQHSFNPTYDVIRSPLMKLLRKYYVIWCHRCVIVLLSGIIIRVRYNSRHFVYDRGSKNNLATTEADIFTFTEILLPKAASYSLISISKRLCGRYFPHPLLRYHRPIPNVQTKSR